MSNQEKLFIGIGTGIFIIVVIMLITAFNKNNSAKVIPSTPTTYTAKESNSVPAAQPCYAVSDNGLRQEVPCKG